MSNTFEEILNKDGVLLYKTNGTSMNPLIVEGRDYVIIRPVKGRLKKYDVPLYKRRDQYVLHRIIKVTDDGYVIRGDNTYNKEYGVTDGDIIGVLSELVRKGKRVSTESGGYRFYCRFWNLIYPLRRVYVKIRYVLHRIFRRK